MRSLLSKALCKYVKHTNRSSEYEDLPPIMKVQCIQEKFRSTFGRRISKTSERYVVYDKKNHKIDLKRTLLRAKQVLDLVDYFRLQCCTNETKDLFATWKICSRKQRKRLSKEGSSGTHALFWYKTAKMREKERGRKMQIPSWEVFSCCVENGWNDAAVEYYRIQEESKKMDLFWNEWIRAVEEDDFALVRRLNAAAEKDFVIDQSIFEHQLDEWTVKQMVQFLMRRKSVQVPADCLVPEIERFYDCVWKILEKRLIKAKSNVEVKPF
ncbi:hypothetical protein QR680_006769 [Steinernema hermaphroditum]|uniref:Uncharacterized protein n=1 Tax=Steinernema hermaphroditum TaxID=289476 RepID=A0AA39HWF6_9BILA|nr:hypothetical protein QR680_006769 [Steinernema hermaphroditum]